VPQYPAAFSAEYHNVIGVGSVGPDGNRSGFSNHGPWVRCCTEGEDVVSTFISGWDGKTEEVEPEGTTGAGTQPVKSFDGWASWSGTSFAAPKVAAELARRKAAGSTLAAGWMDLTTGVPSTWQEMGFLLRGLPPN
jgi:subtilisin family serine protease